MSNYKQDHRSGRQNRNRAKAEHMDEINDSPLMACFRNYAKELDDKHDRHERIVKLGRDITIESKRIIFLLHTIDPRKDNREKILQEADKRLKSLFENNFVLIAKELDGLDQHQYMRAYCFGLQEFIEAYTFYEYLNGNQKMSDWIIIQKKLTYDIDLPSSTDSTETNTSTDDQSLTDSIQKKQIFCLVKPIEFMLGLADVGGEIMRRCINSLGSNDIDACFESCRMLRALYAGYLRLGATGHRDMFHKITTLRQSTLKTENVCYNIRIRGTEAAKWNATGTLFISDKINNENEDEGFY